jgi:hypothetical protein
MSTVTLPLPLPTELFADLRDIAAQRGTTVEELLVKGAESVCRGVYRPLHEDLAEIKGTRAILNSEDINGYKAYYEYMERKHR